MRNIAAQLAQPFSPRSREASEMCNASDVLQTAVETRVFGKVRIQVYFVRERVIMVDKQRIQ